MEIPGDGSLLQKPIVDAMVVDWRRLGAAVNAVMAQDEVAPQGGDLAPVADTVAAQPL
jgi:hypothetical protein